MSMTRYSVASVAAIASALLGMGSVAAQPAAAITAPHADAAPAPRQDSRPNVLVWLLDDTGFAQLSCFGGLVATPNIDRVARMGLRYSNYHTAAICSASRAALLSGRNPHTVHMGAHAASARPFPGYDAHIPASAGSIAANLHHAGYRTFALGKWDHLPAAEMTPAGPYRQWPTGQGFDHFYGFLSADADNWNPVLIQDATPVAKPADPNYLLNVDLANRAIAMIGERDAGASRAPFFMYWATGTAHAPHHAPREWIDRYKGKFDMGWDKAREAILRAQKAQGLVPQAAVLAPRPEGMPAWNSLSADQKKLYARQMEVFAASVSAADEQFGRILDALQASGELDNTMVVVTSDNGASAEGGPDGLYNEAYLVTGGYPSAAENMKFYDEWGGPKTYPTYSFGWAVAGNTPFRYYKQVTHEGGIHVPLVVSWPKGIAARGEIRGQFVHVADIAPTILDAAGVPLAETVNDVRQQPMDGVSFGYSFAAPAAPAPRLAQYYEMNGNKALLSQGWSINTTHRTEAWSLASKGTLDEPWELYDLRSDPGQTRNLANSQPAKVRQLDQLFEEQAKRYNVYPLGDVGDGVKEATRQFMADFKRRNAKWTYAGPVGNIPGMVSPPIALLSFKLTAKLNLPRTDITGPIFASGGQLGGMALYLRDGRPVLVLNSLAGESTQFAASEALPAGDVPITLTFASRDGSDDHAVTISARGRVLAEGTVRVAIPKSFGISEVFGVGIDNGSPVLAGAKADEVFSGGITDVVFDFAQ
jgi:arylsulfatase